MEKKIEELVEVIYRLEQNQIDKKFIELLNGLEEYIAMHQEYQWDSVLLEMQTAYANRNYVRFADLLLYELKPLVNES